MSSLIHRIVCQAKIAFSKRSCNEPAVNALHKLVSQLTAEDVGISESTFRQHRHYKAPVLCITVYSHEDFAVTIFILKQGSRIPLHNHPGMTGILKVLHGSVRIDSFSPMLTPQRSAFSYIFRRGRGLQAVRHEPVTVSSYDEPCRLSPSKGNIHEVRADQGGPVAFFDVLSPPYDNVSRNCTYYAVSCGESPGIVGERCFLQEIPQPSDFWCDGLPYEGPHLNSASDDEVDN